jgi:hypothetical protein
MNTLHILLIILCLYFLLQNNYEYFYPSITMTKLNKDLLDNPNRKLNLNTQINKDEFLYYDLASPINLNNQTNININNDKIKRLLTQQLNKILIIINKNISPLVFNKSLQPIKQSILDKSNDSKIIPYIKYLNNVFVNHNLFIKGKNNVIEYKTDNEIKYDFDLLIDYKIINNTNPLEVYYNDIIISCSIIIKRQYNNEDDFFSKNNNNNINIYVSKLFLRGFNKKYINDN